MIVVYFISMLAIGWYFSKRNNDAADFLLGGRKMPYFPVAVSMLMTVFSTYSLVMGPGEIYNHGLDWGMLSLIMPFIGVVSVMIFTKFFFKIEAFTPFEYLAFRYDKYARLIGAIGNTYSQMIYAGTVLLTTGKIFEAAAGWPCWITATLFTPTLWKSRYACALLPSFRKKPGSPCRPRQLQPRRLRLPCPCPGKAVLRQRRAFPCGPGWPLQALRS